MNASAIRLASRFVPRFASAAGLSLAFHALAIAAMLSFHSLGGVLHRDDVEVIAPVTLVSGEPYSVIAEKEAPPARSDANPGQILPRPKMRAYSGQSKMNTAPQPVPVPAAVETAALATGLSAASSQPTGSTLRDRVSDCPVAYRLGSDDTPAPRYPLSARRKGHQGIVVVSLDISADGVPEAVHIISSSGDEMLDQAASETLARWRLKPALRGGEPVSARIEVPINFVLE